MNDQAETRMVVNVGGGYSIAADHEGRHIEIYESGNLVRVWQDEPPHNSPDHAFYHMARTQFAVESAAISVDTHNIERGFMELLMTPAGESGLQFGDLVGGEDEVAMVRTAYSSGYYSCRKLMLALVYLSREGLQSVRNSYGMVGMPDAARAAYEQLQHALVDESGLPGGLPVDSLDKRIHELLGRIRVFDMFSTELQEEAMGLLELRIKEGDQALVKTE